MTSVSTLHIEELTHTTEPAYEDFVSSHSDGLIYYSLAYRNLLRRTLGPDDRYLIAFEGDRVAGVLPVFAHNSPELGEVVNSLPFYGSHGGVLTNETLTSKERGTIVGRLLDTACQPQEGELFAATFVLSPFETNTTPYADLTKQTDSRIGQITFLPSEHEDGLYDDPLIKRFTVKTRNAVRKAVKNNVSVRQDSSPDAFRWLKTQHEAGMAALGGNPKSDAFFAAVQDVFPPSSVRLYVASLEKKDVAALLVLKYNGVMEYFVPATIPEYRSLQPMSLLVYQSMKHAIDSGCRLYNFGGTWKSQTGVYHFKSGFGARDCPYQYYSVLPNSLDQYRRVGRTTMETAWPHYYVLPFDLLEGRRTTA